jgi:hypothetical protein
MATARGSTACWYILAVVLGALLPGTAAAEWRRIDSPNFIVIGDVGARDLREIALQFEGFRETLSRVLSPRATATPVPTVVVVFPNERAFRPFQPQYEGKPVSVGGVFYGGRDLNYITMVRDARPGAMRIIFHEYAHLVISNVSMSLPAWLNEGLAEYYSTYESSRGGREAMIGRPLESHLRLLGERRLLPLSQLIAVDHTSALYNERERRSIFYAQSWALTHMLLLGEPPRLKELAAYVGQVQTGVPADEAWQAAFGNALVERDLEAYVRRDTFRLHAFTFPERLGTFEAPAVPLAPEQVAGFLAGLRIRQQRLDDAEALLAPLPGATTPHPHVQVAAAALDIARQDHRAASERLLELGAIDDWYVAYTAGRALTALLERAPGADPERIDAARALLRAVADRREIPHVLAGLATLEMLGSRPPGSEALATIQRARTLAPGRDDYALIHARLLAEGGEFEAARAIIGPLMVPGVPEHIRAAARSWMGNVVRLEERRRAAAARDAPPDRSAPADPPVPPAEVAGGLQLILRELQPGEQRLEGFFERIECPGGPAVRLHVRAADGAHVFHAPALAEVDFITYRGDLGGEIHCGPVKPPMRVLVTWRDGLKPGSRTAVALEFLPDGALQW